MNAIDIASYFLAKTSDDDEELLTQLKLQKLLYYAQGLWLALNDGTPLFREACLAWEHGPVFRSVWDHYRDYRGGKPIPACDIDLEKYPAEVQEFLDEVYDAYGQFSAWKLRHMTHAEPPWRQAAPNGVIADRVMKDYFKTILV